MQRYALPSEAAPITGPASEAVYEAKRPWYQRFLSRHPRLTSAGLIFLLLLFNLPFTVSSFVGLPGSAMVLSLLVVAITHTALWRRNTHTERVFWIVYSTEIVGMALALTISVEAYYAVGSLASLAMLLPVARWLPAKRSRLYLLLSLAETLAIVSVMAVQEIRGTSPLSGSAAGNLIALIVLTGFIMGLQIIVFMVGKSSYNARMHREEIRTWVVAQQRSAQVEERSRIARELHDVVAHSLTMMITLADGAKVVTGNSPEKGRELMGEVSATGRSALGEMRRVLGILRSEDAQPVPLGPPPTEDDVRSLVQSFVTAGMPVRLVTNGQPWPQDPGLMHTVYRVVQESLTNALRYAKSASEVRVELQRTPEGLCVRVADNGLSGGAAESQGAGLGLEGLRTRVGAFDGTLTAGPAGTQGWEVCALFPEAAMVESQSYLRRPAPSAHTSPIPSAPPLDHPLQTHPPGTQERTP